MAADDCDRTTRQNGLRIEALERVVDERDRLYQERARYQEQAFQAALAASRELTEQAFKASDDARAKVEQAQHVYNVGHNDLIRKGDEQTRETLIACKDLIAQLRGELTKEISYLKESMSSHVGQEVRGKEVATRITDWAAILIAAGVAFAAAWIVKG